jgi:GntR family transcriptional regulator / MocR family aminotransferase
VSQSWSTFGLDLYVPTVGGGRRAALEDSLREAIRGGRLVGGARLPSSRALALDLALSRGTVAAAYDQLIAEGYLEARQGAGTRVVGAVAGAASGRAASDRGAVAAGLDSRTRARLNLLPGTPDVRSFPVAAWLRATRKALAVAPPDAFSYGDQRGRPELRRALADYLGRTRGVVASPDQIVVTSGYSQTLWLLCMALKSSGIHGVAMEDPCLPYHREVVRRAGQSVLAVPVDERGIRSDQLVSGAISSVGAVGAVVTTAAHQYPTGVVLDPERRRALTRWARSTGGLVVEDDYDGEFRYDRQPVGSLQGTAPDVVAYAGTTSKTLGPGLRLGWVVLPPALVEPVTEARMYTDHSTNSIAQLALAELITSHVYDRHVRACRLRYRRRRDLLRQRVEQVGSRTQIHPVRGIAAGLQAVVELPASGPTEDEVIAMADAEGLALEGMRTHFHAAGGRPFGLVIGFGTPSERDYPAAISLLCRILRRAYS